MNIKNSYSSLSKELRKLTKFYELHQIGDAITRSEETRLVCGVDPKYNQWTLLKLTAIFLYVPLYTRIISNHFGEYYLVDLFAGSGIGYIDPNCSSNSCKCNEETIRIAGTPLMSICYATPQFTKIYLNDIDQRKIDLLNKRLNYLENIASQQKKPSWIFDQFKTNIVKFYKEDSNKALEDILNDIEDRNKQIFQRIGKKAHALIIIDQEGMDLNRDTLDRILRSSVRNDLFILFNTQGVGLQAYNSLRMGHSSDALDRHLGPQWKDAVRKYAEDRNKKPEDLSKSELSDVIFTYYMNEISKQQRIVVGIRIPMRLRPQPLDLIFATPRTQSGNRYINAIKYIKELVEETDINGRGWLAEALYEFVLKGELPGLLSYMINNPGEILRKYSTSKRYLGKNKD
jgi:three-Cys-motif partner protein